MRTTALSISVAGVAAGMTLSVAPVATAAAGGVYGGSTRAGEAIVLKTNAAGKRVRSAVVAFAASCDDGDTYLFSVNATATRPSPGFDPSPEDLVMQRNRAGRFAGTVVAAEGLNAGELAGIVTAEVRGRLRKARASGSLSGEVAIVSTDTGEQVAACSTGTVRWTASRDAGRIYGGATSQDEPVVARLDQRRRRVMAVYVAGRARECNPEGLVRIPGRYVSFRVDRRGRWGDSWEDEEALDAGATASLSYALGGTVRRTSMRGTLSVDLERRDAAGVVDMTCRTGAIRWTASTG